ncbi:MAG: SDR family NAD(P)-dependent oxidoreductase [Nitriliruptoraceae bacterium]
MDHLVIVTGGSSGIGHALLATAPGSSHRITVSRRAAEDVAPGYLEADLADPSAWERVGHVIDAVATEREWRRITLLQAAGTLEPIGFAGEVDPLAYERNLLLNAVAPLALGHRFLAAVSHLRCRRELAIVTSGAAEKDYEGWSSYGAAKAAVDRWVATAAAEQARRGGTRVLALNPGTTATPMQDLIRTMDPRDFPQVERFRQRHAQGRLADPVAVAEACWAALEDETVPAGSKVDLQARLR